nr:ABC transporter permease [Rhizobium rhizogenes]
MQNLFLYALRRTAVAVPSLLFVVFIVYTLSFYGAGDPIKLIFLRAPGDVAFDPQRVEAMREGAGLNRPFFVQFASYVWNGLQGNFGNSLVSGRSVASMVGPAAKVSLQLGLATIVLTAIAGIPLGAIAAFRKHSAVDRSITTVCLFLWALPPYVIGPLLMVAVMVFVPQYGVPTGWGGLTDHRIILPLLVLSLQPIAQIQRQTRSAVIDAVTENHVRTARAKGLPRHLVAWRHVLRPVLTPIVTQMGMLAITFINGAIFSEVVFGLPGLGRLTVSAMTDADYPVILAITLLGTLSVIAANLAVDLLYPLIDPRVRLP